MKNKGIIWLAVLGFVLFAMSVPLLTFTSLEKKLDKEASALNSVSSLEDADLDWNGRSCYLTVPANIDRDAAESAAADIEELQGVRKVKIIYDESKTINNEIEEVTAEKVPGEFKLNWTDENKSITGKLDEINAGKLEDIFGASGLDIDPDAGLSNDVLDKLELIAESLYADLSEGTLEVSGDKIKISGLVSETADIDDLAAKWGSLEGVELDLQMPEAANQTVQAQSEIDKILEANSIEFDFASVTITPESEETIDKIAEVLKNYEEIDIDIIGHTDSKGAMSSNLNLSKLRSEAVLNKLVEKGIDVSRMTADGNGETEPVDTNDTEEGRQNNRRVEIIVRGND